MFYCRTVHLSHLQATVCLLLVLLEDHTRNVTVKVLGQLIWRFLWSLRRGKESAWHRDEFHAARNLKRHQSHTTMHRIIVSHLLVTSGVSNLISCRVGCIRVVFDLGEDRGHGQRGRGQLKVTHVIKCHFC